MWLDFTRFADTFSTQETLKRVWRHGHCFPLFDSSEQVETPFESQASPQTPPPQEVQ